MYGRQSEIAIAAIARLAEVYDGGRTRLSAGAIARDRGLRAPFVAKLLTVLARAGIVVSTPGPGGGFSLARPPSKITLHHVLVLFEREAVGARCLFGGACTREAPCAFHSRMRALEHSLDELTRSTTLESLRRHLAPTQDAPEPQLNSGRLTQPKRTRPQKNR